MCSPGCARQKLLFPTLWLVSSAIILIAAGCGKTGEPPAPHEAEKQPALPEFYGVYAVAGGKTIAIDKDHADVGPKANLLIYDKKVVASGSEIKLNYLNVKLELPNPPSITGTDQDKRSKTTWDSNIEQLVATAFADSTPHWTTIDIRIKPVPDKAEMVQIVPVADLKPGLYSMGDYGRFIVDRDAVCKECLTKARVASDLGNVADCFQWGVQMVIFSSDQKIASKEFNDLYSTALHKSFQKNIDEGNRKEAVKAACWAFYNEDSEQERESWRKNYNEKILGGEIQEFIKALSAGETSTARKLAEGPDNSGNYFRHSNGSLISLGYTDQRIADFETYVSKQGKFKDASFSSFDIQRKTIWDSTTLVATTDMTVQFESRTQRWRTVLEFNGSDWKVADVEVLDDSVAAVLVITPENLRSRFENSLRSKATLKGDGTQDTLIFDEDKVTWRNSDTSQVYALPGPGDLAKQLESSPPIVRLKWVSMSAQAQSYNPDSQNVTLTLVSLLGDSGMRIRLDCADERGARTRRDFFVDPPK